MRWVSFCHSPWTLPRCKTLPDQDQCKQGGRKGGGQRPWNSYQSAPEVLGLVAAATRDTVAGTPLGEPGGRRWERSCRASRLCVSKTAIRASTLAARVSRHPAQSVPGRRTGCGQSRQVGRSCDGCCCFCSFARCCSRRVSRLSSRVFSCTRHRRHRSPCRSSVSLHMPQLSSPAPLPCDGLASSSSPAQELHGDGDDETRWPLGSEGLGDSSDLGGLRQPMYRGDL